MPDFLSHLKEVASSPYAFVAYICVVAAWLYSAIARNRLKHVSKIIKEIPEKDRRDVILREYNTNPRAGLSAEQWIRARRDILFFVSFLSTLIAALLIVVIAVSRTTIDKNGKQLDQNQSLQAQNSPINSQIQPSISPSSKNSSTSTPETTPNDDNEASRAAIRKILTGCNRRSVFTRMKGEINRKAMYDSIAECRSIVQSNQPLINSNSSSQAAAKLISALDEIERQRRATQDNKKIDRLKLTVIRGLMQLSKSVNLAYTLPPNLVNDYFFTKEEADAAPESPHPSPSPSPSP